MVIIKNRSRSGFSLMEMLVVVMIIGIIANMAIFSFSGNYTESNKIKDRRNAQTIASLAATASVAGANFIVSGDIAATVDNLKDGVTPTSGVFKGREFKLPEMAAKEITGAIAYLAWSGDDLIYKR